MRSISPPTQRGSSEHSLETTTISQQHDVFLHYPESDNQLLSSFSAKNPNILEGQVGFSTYDDMHLSSKMYQHRNLISSLKQSLIVLFDEHDALLPLIGTKREMLHAALDSFLFEAICRAQDVKNQDMNQLHQVLELKEALRRQKDVNQYYQLKAKDSEKKIHDQGISLLMVTGKLKRRENDLDEQREKFYKEISVLKEMLYRRDSQDPKQASRRQDKVELINWEQELQKRGQSSEESDDTPASQNTNSSQDQALEELSKKYKLQIQSINRKHKIEMDALTNKMGDQVKKLETRLQDQQTYFDNFSSRMGDATTEVTNLNKKLAMLELEKGNLQRVIDELEKKILMAQEIECQLQGTVSDKLNEIKDLQQELAEYKKHGGYIMHQGKRVNLQEAKEMIAEGFRNSLTWKKSEERYNVELSRLSMMNEDLIMKFHRISLRSEELQKQYEVKSSQLRDKTETLNKLSSGDADYFRRIEKEAQQKTEVAKELSEKILRLEGLNMQTKQKLADTERLVESHKSEIRQLEGSRQTLQNTIQELEEDIEAANFREKELKEIISELKGGKGSHSKSSLEDLSGHMSEVQIIEKMDVFRRLQKRHQIMDEKRKNKRNYLLRERQAHLERILDTAGNLRFEEDNPDRALTPMEKQNSGYWKDLRSFLSKEMEERQKRSDSQQILANLLGPNSMAEISQESMQKELSRILEEEHQQKGFTAQMPLSPRPRTARTSLRKFSVEPKGAEGSADEGTTSASDGRKHQNDVSQAESSAPATPQVPVIPKLYTKVMHSTSASRNKRPATARMRKRKKNSTPTPSQPSVPHSDRPSKRRYSAASVWRRKPGSALQHRPQVVHSARASGHSTPFASADAPATLTPRPPSAPRISSAPGVRRTAHIQMPSVGKVDHDGQSKYPSNVSASEYILQTSRQVRLDHQQRKKVIWEMQFKEEEPIEAGHSLVSVPLVSGNASNSPHHQQRG
uniref:Uncharacterized protein n=1 Tax=Percolomonas cosmopolitus TaxID=63605 RepID=A0A7S1PGY7_9EUKA|mmetsp:Transcript_10927/g.40735  ORF Transcript_10927/g.40735 Transcript_10927/m.40735 type:complete len:969 (+) Transcript_10927:185-3091(+)